MRDEQFSVAVHYAGKESHANLTPVLDALESEFGAINITISRPDPNASGRGGGYPAALQLTLDLNSVFDVVKLAAGLYAAAFLAELGKEDAKALRQKILKVAIFDTSASEDVSITALSIMIGPVQFYVYAPMTEQELAIALQQAKELVASMTDERIRAGGWPINWDPSSHSWHDHYSRVYREQI